MSNTKRLVIYSLLVAVGITLHIFEAILPVLYFMPVPGAKLGLANIVTLLTLVLFGYREAVAVVLFRSLLGSLLSGTFLTTTFFLSFAGALGSSVAMGLVYNLSRGYFGLVGVSVAGAITHNVCQLLVAAALIQQSGIFLYLPYLLLFALPTGYFTGLVVNFVLRHRASLGLPAEDCLPRISPKGT